MVGGLGDDGYVVDNGGDLIVENAGEGTEAVYAFANYTLADNVENLWLFDAATSGGGNAGDNLLVANVDVGSTLYGLAGADALVGENGADVLYGGADNDFLNGQAGADTLVGGQGSDYLYGGAGADTFLYTAASDSIGAAGAMDAILDFEIGVDKVNLHGVLGGAGDSVSLLTNSDGTYILVDLGGDGSEDMRILLYHTTGVTMSDLVL
jgi:Ca2+-binding RTX toxin-like protein